MNKKNEFYEHLVDGFFDGLKESSHKEIVERVYTKNEIAKMFKDYN